MIAITSDATARFKRVSPFLLWFHFSSFLSAIDSQTAPVALSCAFLPCNIYVFANLFFLSAQRYVIARLSDMRASAGRFWVADKSAKLQCFKKCNNHGSALWLTNGNNWSSCNHFFDRYFWLKMDGIFAINSVLCSAVASLSASRKHSRIATRESGTRNNSLRSITAQKQADIPAMKSNRLLSAENVNWREKNCCKKQTD